MIAELVMHCVGWSDSWYAHPGHFGIKNYVSRFGPRFYVGFWTGEEHDLICVKPCKSNREAENWQSPPGWTYSHAAIRALWLLYIKKGRFDTNE